MPFCLNTQHSVLSTQHFFCAVLIAVLVVAGGCRRKDKGAVPVVFDEAAARASIARADELYAQRGELLKVRQGIIELRQALSEDYRNYDAAWRLAKFSYYFGAHTTQNAERDQAFRDGIEAGKLAVRLREDLPEGHFWLGANYGGSAQGGALAGLAAIEDVRREMEIVLRLDHSYQGGSAYMVLGQVYLQAPKMFGGDAEKAVATMEQGLMFGDDNALLRLRLAEAYAAVDRPRDARQQINSILALKPDPDYLPEYDEAATGARQLAEKLRR